MTEAETSTSEKLAELGRSADEVLASIERFPEIVESYLSITGTPATQFGKAAGGGIDFVRHMREPRDLRRGTIQRVLKHISESGKAVELLA